MDQRIEYKMSSELTDLWNKYSAGEVSRDAYRLYASVINTGLVDLSSFLDRAHIASIMVQSTGCHIQLLDGSIFQWDPRQIGSAPNLLLTEGKYEPFETEILRFFSRSASTFVDLGANIGYFTIRLSIDNPLLQTVAVEATPSTAKILTENISLNHLSDRIMVINKAVGATPGSCQIFLPTVSGHSAASIRDQHPEEGSEVVDVEMDTISTILKDVPITSDDLIKMDVEGAEFEVFKGSKTILEISRPTIFAELLRKWMKTFNSHPNDVIRFLGSYDYLCLQFAKDRLERITEVDDTTIPTNFLFVQDNKLAELELHGFVDS
jgi:FkbM family methyltransferase